MAGIAEILLAEDSDIAKVKEMYTILRRQYEYEVVLRNDSENQQFVEDEVENVNLVLENNAQLKGRLWVRFESLLSELMRNTGIKVLTLTVPNTECDWDCVHFLVNYVCTPPQERKRLLNSPSIVVNPTVKDVCYKKIQSWCLGRGGVFIRLATGICDILLMAWLANKLSDVWKSTAATSGGNPSGNTDSTAGSSTGSTKPETSLGHKIADKALADFLAKSVRVG
ncbi:unnamed protein product [Prunus brigantina]